MYLEEIFEYKNERFSLFCNMVKAYIFVFNLVSEYMMSTT